MADIKNRIMKFDNTKAFLILLVVFGHGISPFTSNMTMKWAELWLYSFHMPLFMFLSGLFAKKAVNSDSLDFSKVVGFGLLGMFMKVLTYFTSLACGQNPKFTLLEENGVAWYIFVMAVHMIISYVLRKLTPWKVMFTSVVIALLAGCVDDIGNVFVLSRIITFFPAFYLGVITNKDTLLNFVNKPAVRVTSAFVLIFFTLGLYFVIEKVFGLRYMLTGNNPYYEILGQEKYWGVLLRLGCYCMSFVLGVCVLSVIPNKRIPLFSFLGSRTLSVYALHRPVQIVMGSLFLNDALSNLQARYILLAVMGISVVLTLVLALKPFDYILYPCTRWEKFFSPLIRWFRKPEYK